MHICTTPGNMAQKLKQMQLFSGVHMFCLHWIIFLMSDPIVAHFYLLIFIAGQNAALGNTERLNNRLHQSHHMTQLM